LYKYLPPDKTLESSGVKNGDSIVVLSEEDTIFFEVEEESA
jgi:hypothetical protein